MYYKNIFEVFDEFQKAESRDDKKRVLINNWNWTLETVLKATFHPEVYFSIENVPYYKPSDMPAGMGYSNMTRELQRIYLFQPNHPQKPAGLTPEKTNKLLIGLLESLESREAIVFMNMLLKDQKIPNLDYAIVKEVAPYLLP